MNWDIKANFGKALWKFKLLGKNHFFQSGVRLCPVCKQSAPEFRDYGNPARSNAECPTCGALERHRFAWLLLQERSNLFDGNPKTVLHVAPEGCFEARLRETFGSGYITADFLRTDVDVQMDITKIEMPSGHFGVILCSHVLEHIPDDKAAMAELYRVLQPGGFALLDVPIFSGRTYEDPTIVEPKDRLREFGQEDHVRKYGIDYVGRLQQVGFSVDVIKVEDLRCSKFAEKYGILPLNRMNFLCKKLSVDGEPWADKQFGSLP
jgi:SAM-dependent methyltransferase